MQDDAVQFAATLLVSLFAIAVWTLAFLSLSIFLVGTMDYFFAMCGLFCGIVYCALAFLHRDKTVEG
jgi:hypothetical protein